MHRPAYRTAQDRCRDKIYARAAPIYVGLQAGGGAVTTAVNGAQFSASQTSTQVQGSNIYDSVTVEGVPNAPEPDMLTAAGGTVSIYIAELNQMPQINWPENQMDSVSRQAQTNPYRFTRQAPMSQTIAPLIIDFLTWLAAEPRDYNDVMDAWRTSCPRLTVWEDAIDANLIARIHIPGHPIRIELTAQGSAMLAANLR